MGSGDLGERAAGRGHEWNSARHRFDGRQGEAFVQRGHDGQFGFAVELDDAGVGHARHELDAVVQPELGHHRAGVAVGPAPADDGQFDVPFGAQLGDRLEEEAESLHGHVG